MLLHNSGAMLGRHCFAPPFLLMAGSGTESVKYFIILLVSKTQLLKSWEIDILFIFAIPYCLYVGNKEKAQKQLPNLSRWIESCSGLVIFVLHLMVKYCATLYIVIHYWKSSFKFLSFSTFPLCLKSLIPLLPLDKSWVNRHLDNC